jgi:hypothetical protein
MYPRNSSLGPSLRTPHRVAPPRKRGDLLRRSERGTRRNASDTAPYLLAHFLLAYCQTITEAADAMDTLPLLVPFIVCPSGQ